MDTNVETTTTQRGRHTKTPTKYQHTGSLGAAAGGGGLLSRNQKLLPGITETTPETTGDAAASNTQIEGGAGRPREVVTTAPAPSGKGEGEARVDPQLVAAIKQAPTFSADDDDDTLSSQDTNSYRIDVSNDSDDDEGDSDDAQDGDGAMEMRSGREQSIGSGAGSSNGHGSGAASAGAPALAKTHKALQRSINRNRTKSYERWPASLLQQACSLRKIAGYSKSGDVDKMAGVLTQLDNVMSRSSPYLMDLEDRAAGD